MLRKTSNMFQCKNAQKQYISLNNYNRNQSKDKTPHNQIIQPNNLNVQSHLNTFQQNFKIYLRVKPTIIQQQPASTLLSPNALHKNLEKKIPQQCIKIHSRNSVEIIPPYYTSQQDRVFGYEQIFNGQACNAEVFSKTMISPIQNALQGFNSTIFIYGMTGAGKTYSMFGNQSTDIRKNSLFVQKQRIQNIIGQEQGLVDMTLATLFRQIKTKQQIKTQVGISFFEIYNENIKDLLGPNGSNGPNLNVVQDPNRGVYIIDLKQTPVSEQAQAKNVIKQGLQRRAMNATKSNQASSRSHAILQFSIKRYIPTTENDKFTMLESKLFMIDLAGNQKTGNHEAKRFIEGVNINKSLLTLGKCMSILAQQKKNSFVPFRDSKLTRILKESLGGNSKTVMIACISSQKKFYQQTLNTLKYSTIAKRIKNRGIKNNIKIIAKQEIPTALASQNNNCNSQTLEQNFESERTYEQNHQQMASVRFSIGQLLSKLMRLSQQKANMQRSLQELHNAKNQLYLHIKNSSFKNDKPLKSQAVQIGQLINAMNLQYSLTLKKLESAYNQVLSMLQQKNCIKSSYNGNPCNFQTNGFIKNNRDQQSKNVNKSLKKSLEAVSKNQNMYRSLFNKQNSSIKQSQALQIQNKAKKRNKQLNIQCCYTEQPYKAALLSEIKDCKNSQKRKFQQHVPCRQVCINLDGASWSRNKEQFIKKLKQTQKTAKGASKEDITKVLQQYQANQYDLSNIEKSMMRKLRFFQRQISDRDEQSSRKSQSLRNRSRTPANKSIIFKKNCFKL